MDDYSLKHVIARKKTVYAKYKQTKSDNDYSFYITMKICCEREMRKSKRNIEINIARQARTNPKKFPVNS